jgi:hypothetical protein
VTDEVEAEGAKGSEQAIELKLGLRVAGLAFVPGEGTEAGGAAVAIGTLLGEDPPHAAPRRVYREENGAVRTVVDGNEGWRGNYGIFEGQHSTFMLFLPDKGCTFAGEFYEGASE